MCCYDKILINVKTTGSCLLHTTHTHTHTHTHTYLTRNYICGQIYEDFHHNNTLLYCILHFNSS